MWIILYIVAHWLFCWNYCVCSIELKRKITVDYQSSKQKKIFTYQNIELGVSVLILISFTLTASLIVNSMNSLYYQVLILTFQSISLIFLTLALIRIRSMINNHPVFKLSNRAMYAHWLLLVLAQLLCILLFIYRIVITRHPNSANDTRY